MTYIMPQSRSPAWLPPPKYRQLWRQYQQYTIFSIFMVQWFMRRAFELDIMRLIHIFCFGWHYVSANTIIRQLSPIIAVSLPPVAVSRHALRWRHYILFQRYSTLCSRHTIFDVSILSLFSGVGALRFYYWPGHMPCFQVFQCFAAAAYAMATQLHAAHCLPAWFFAYCQICFRISQLKLWHILGYYSWRLCRYATRLLLSHFRTDDYYIYFSFTHNTFYITFIRYF